MKAEHFRIGNWVNYQGRNFKIHGINKDIPFLDTIEFGDGVVDWSGLKPIPLTEEWLERFGFEKDEEYDEGGLVDYRMILMSGSLEFVSFWNSEEITGVNQPQTGVDIEYVHQLQNLYFALTGEELELKK